MKTCIKTRDLRHVGQTLSYSPDRSKVMGLMKRSEQYQFVELSEQLRSDDRRSGMTRATMHDSVPHADNARVSERRAQPLSQVLQRGLPIRNRNIDRGGR